MPWLMFESSMRNSGLPQWRGLYASGREFEQSPRALQLLVCSTPGILTRICSRSPFFSALVERQPWLMP